MRMRKIAAGILFGLCAASASAQMGYPSRPIRMVVDTSPGGLTDILGRVAAEGLAQQLGRQVVVENKAGASGNVAIEYVVKSSADGHTLLIGAGGTSSSSLSSSTRFLSIRSSTWSRCSTSPRRRTSWSSRARFRRRISRSSSRMPERTRARSTTARRGPAARRTSPPINSRASPACSSCTCPTRALGRRSPISSRAACKSCP